MMGVVPILQSYFNSKCGFHEESAGASASILGGSIASMLSQPFDVVKV